MSVTDKPVAFLGTNLDGESEAFLTERQAEFWSNGASKVEPLYLHPSPSTEGLGVRAEDGPALQQIMGRFQIYMEMQPEEDEDWESWYHAAFDMLRSEVRTILSALSTSAEQVVTDATRDVLTERKRQVEVEGWAPEHDDSHDRGEMATAAACYASPDAVYWGPRRSLAALEWPWDVSWWKPCDGKMGRPLDRRRELVKAGALILAEIERLDRAAALSPIPDNQVEG